MSIEAQPAGRPGAREVDWPGLTVEAILYAVLIVGAAFVRFYDLGRWPLLTGEAAEALAAWRFLHGQGAAGPATPFLFGSTLAGLFAFGASDAVVRLAPAVLGTGLVLVPLALRRRLGSWGALASTFVLAFSPTLVYFSRTLAGPVPALAGLGAVLVAADWAGRREWQRARVLGAAGLAVGLTSSPWVYTFLLAAFVYLSATRLAEARGGPAGERAGWDLLRDRGAWTALAIPLGLISTALLLRVGGVQGTADLLGTWLGRLWPGSAGRSWAYTLGMLGFYEAGVLVLGLGGLAVGLQRRDRWVGFLGLWTLLAVLLTTISGARDAEAVAFTLLPLGLLVGLAVSAIVARLRPVQWTWAAGLATVLSVLVVFWWLLSVAYGNVEANVYYGLSKGAVAALALLTPVVIVGATLVFYELVGRAETGWALAFVGLAFGGGLLVHQCASLNYVHARDAREPLVVAPTSVDLKDMVTFLDDWSVRRALDQHELTVAVDADLEPLVTWYLRDFGALRVLRSPLDDPSAGALVLRADPAQPVLHGYARQRFRLRTSSDAPLGYGRQALSYWLVGTGGGAVQAEAFELWVKP